MYLSYIDESGDTGSRTQGGSRTYTLASVAVSAAEWADVFDELVKFRRHLKTKFGVPARAEIKANWLVRSAGDLRPLNLNDVERRAIYELHMKLLNWNRFSVMAVVIDKPPDREPVNVSDLAWESMFQRLERFSAPDKGNAGPAVIIHDEGDETRIRKQARQRRRYGTAGGAFGGQVRRDFRLLTDDPHPKNSKHSYFVQLADLVAYAAYRRCVPPPAMRINVVTGGTYPLIGSSRNDRAAGLSPRIAAERSVVYRDDA